SPRRASRRVPAGSTSSAISSSTTSPCASTGTSIWRPWPVRGGWRFGRWRGRASSRRRRFRRPRESAVGRAAGPLTPPSPSLPTHALPPGERGLEKAVSSFAVSLLARVGGREAGEEGRGGEGPGGGAAIDRRGPLDRSPGWIPVLPSGGNAP